METQNKYTNGKIYRITDNDETKFYIGSTIKSLAKRMSEHRAKYKEYLNGTYHKISAFQLFDEFGLENCNIELIEEYSCENRKDLSEREAFYIKRMGCVNIIVPGRTVMQRYFDNHEKMLQQAQERRNKHRLERNQKDSEPIVCECGCVCSRRNIYRHRTTPKHINLMN